LQKITFNERCYRSSALRHDVIECDKLFRRLALRA
jgi:hypothetical protein